MHPPASLPLLFTFYFTDKASTARDSTSPRFRKWARAYDDWLEVRRTHSHPRAVANANLEWKRLVKHVGKLPWQITQQDIESHALWMGEMGLSKATINNAIAVLDAFYAWCDALRVDKYCQPGYNPARDVPRFKLPSYLSPVMWTRSDVQALLAILARDLSDIGRRDNAFFLARIHLGVPTRRLINLKWEQIRQAADGVWVQWRQDGQPVPLPAPVWDAILEFLSVSGRLEAMSVGMYIFPPSITGFKPDDIRSLGWVEDKPLSIITIKNSLQLYGRQVGIPAEKLNLIALRRSILRFRLDQGETMPGMHAFMDSTLRLSHLQSKLADLPPAPPPGPAAAHPDCSVVPLPSRSADPRRSGILHSTHGLYKNSIDPQAVEGLLAENVQGIDQEIACLRELMSGVLSRSGHPVHLADAYTLATRRLDDLLAAADHLQPAHPHPRLEQFLRDWDAACLRIGHPPSSQDLRRAALDLTPQVAQSRHLMASEIAIARLLLRNAYHRAMQEIDTDEYLRILNLYALGCTRLACLLRTRGGDEYQRLLSYHHRMVETAIRELRQEWGLD